MLIFGAGASFGSCDSCVPPVTSGLIDELIKFDPKGWGCIPKKFLAFFKHDFEKGFFDFTNEFPDTLGPLQRAMACYFFTFTASPSNLFVKLAKRIKESNWHNPIITLNYDRFLDTALNSCKISNVMPGTPDIKLHLDNNKPFLPVYYPHGSCNLFYSREKISFTGRSGFYKLLNNTEFFPFAKISGDNVSRYSDFSDFKTKVKRNFYPPIMSYVIPSKITNVGEEFLKFQRKKINVVIQQASKIGIIGVRVRVHDKHLWEPLAKTDASIIYCSGENGKKEFEFWTAKYRSNKNKDIAFNSKWENCFDDFLSNFSLHENNKSDDNEKDTFQFLNSTKVNFSEMKEFVKKFQ